MHLYFFPVNGQSFDSPDAKKNIFIFADLKINFVIFIICVKKQVDLNCDQFPTTIL